MKEILFRKEIFGFYWEKTQLIFHQIA